jgi:hypothetical protein
MPIELRDVRRISAGATRTVKVDCSLWLDGDALLTGTPSVDEVTTTALTISNKSINTSVVTINKQRVAIGKAVLFVVTMPANGAGTTYRVRVTPTSDDSPANSEPIDLFLRCV